MSNSNNLPKLEYEDINSGYGTLNKDISKKFDNRKGILFEKNNILFGKLRPYLKKWYLSNFKGIALGDFWVLKTKGTNVNFVYYLIQSSSYQKVANNTSGTKMPRSDWKSVSQSPFYIPSIPEQSRVGNILKDVDLSITLQQRQLDLYKKLKKGLLQKLFPKNGEKVPEVRFTNFHDDWEQLPFSKIGTNFSYGLNVSSKEYDGKNKYIRITDIDDSNHKLIEKNLTSPNANLEDIKDYQLKENDLLFARTGASVGKSYLYDNNDGKVFFAGFLIRMEINNKFDKNFVFQNTLTDKYQQFVKITSQRSGQPGINAKEYASFKIFISKSLNEQKMIGKLCFRLNNLINLQQDKLEELKFLKKYLLQNMFI